MTLLRNGTSNCRQLEKTIDAGQVQLEPPKEYVLIVADDLLEWERLKEYFQLQHVRRGGYHEDSPFDDIGLQRVVRASDFLKRIDDDRGDPEQGASEQNA